MIKKYLLFALITGNSLLWGQTPAVSIPIMLTDSSKAVTTLFFGLDPTASDSLDKALDEQPLPPLPPAGAFDARFLLPNSLEASLKDFRKGSSQFNGTMVHEIQYQLGSGSMCTLSWTLPNGITAELQDEILGTLIDVKMSGVGSYTITNPAITKLKLTVNYALKGTETIPQAPVLLSPLQGALNTPVSPKLVWAKSTGAVTYTVQVSLNNSFSSFVINDSTQTDTVKQISGLLYNTVYYWRVMAQNSAGSSSFSTTFSFTSVVTSLQCDGRQIPDAFSLEQNYPNPFNPTTVINYQLPKAGRATLAIYDMLGKKVAELVNEQRAAGRYQAEFNAAHFSSGIYFYQLECNDFKSIRKMMLIK